MRANVLPAHNTHNQVALMRAQMADCKVNRAVEDICDKCHSHMIVHKGQMYKRLGGYKIVCADCYFHTRGRRPKNILWCGVSKTLTNIVIANNAKRMTSSNVVTKHKNNGYSTSTGVRKTDYKIEKFNK